MMLLFLEYRRSEAVFLEAQVYIARLKQQQQVVILLKVPYNH